MMNAHTAIHVSKKGEKVVTQPRDRYGKFLSPVRSARVFSSSFHITFNGKPVRLQEMKK